MWNCFSESEEFVFGCCFASDEVFGNSIFVKVIPAITLALIAAALLEER